MNTKEILEKLKLTFSELVSGAEVPAETAPEMVAPIKAKLKDGTEVEITELGVGGVVTIAGQPAPAGEHTLEDGTVIVVGDNGVITEMKPAQGAPMVEDMSAKFSAFESATNEKFSSYEAKFADYEAKLSKATKVIEGLLSLTQTLAEQPTGIPDPVVTGKNNFSQTEKPTKNYSLLFS
jgi:hypothetical protein